MTVGWSRTFKTLAGIAGVSAVGMLGCGFLSSRGNMWQRFAIAFSLGMSGSMIAALGMALFYYMRIRNGMRRIG
jgi:hypothetical protein